MGYVLNSSDCNDNNSAIRPGAIEVCDGIDNDCDTTVDEGCSGSFAVNDQRSNAIPLVITPLGSCNSVSGDLSQASPSSQAQSICITGEDLWYSFVAVTSGMRAQVNSIQNNILIEVQDASGNMVNVENLQSVPGNEILNYGDLEAGEQYFISVRNFNSAQGSGQFSLCLNWLQESTCDMGAGPYNMCAMYKADFTNTMNYVFHFTPILGGETISHLSLGSTKVKLENIAGLNFNTTYNVTIDAVYTMSNGLGQSEQVQVSGSENCTVIMGMPNTTQVRSIDGCPNMKNLYSYIQATPHVCGNLGYEWEIQRTDITSAVMYRTSPNNSRFLQLTPANGFVSGGSYVVRVRPIVNSAVVIPFGPPRCVQLSGATLPLVNSEKNKALNFSFYPNPADEFLNVQIEGANGEGIQYEILDISGRRVQKNKILLNENYNSVLDISSLVSGLYYLRIFDMSETKSHAFIKK
jgi:hypothetical protein